MAENGSVKNGKRLHDNHNEMKMPMATTAATVNLRYEHYKYSNGNDNERKLSQCQQNAGKNCETNTTIAIATKVIIIGLRASRLSQS